MKDVEREKMCVRARIKYEPETYFQNWEKSSELINCR
jgi:hypothetical protein